jgi:cystinosin
VVGLSLDFQLLNLLGFGCYAVYNAALFWDPSVRREYSCLNDGALPAVHANDVFFALHAFVVTAATLVQCALYDRGGQKISWPAALGAGGAAASIAAYLAAVIGAAVEGGGSSTPAAGATPGVSCGSILSWLSFLYFLSYIKLGVSLVKYIPQVGGSCGAAGCLGGGQPGAASMHVDVGQLLRVACSC